VIAARRDDGCAGGAGTAHLGTAAKSMTAEAASIEFALTR
jgi:hypothetical protein